MSKNFKSNPCPEQKILLVGQATALFGDQFDFMVCSQLFLVLVLVVEIYLLFFNSSLTEFTGCYHFGCKKIAPYTLRLLFIICIVQAYNNAYAEGFAPKYCAIYDCITVEIV